MRHNLLLPKILLISCSAVLFSACYSFKGISIAPGTKTYSVQLFKNNAITAPPTLAQDFTERLKDKIRNNTSLILSNGDNADLQFEGQVTGYDVLSQTSQQGVSNLQNQLRITFNVELTDTKNEKNSWKQSFSFQADFPGNSDLLIYQATLVKTITNKVLDDVFNKAFTENW